MSSAHLPFGCRRQMTTYAWSGVSLVMRRWCSRSSLRTDGAVKSLRWCSSEFRKYKPLEMYAVSLPVLLRFTKSNVVPSTVAVPMTWARMFACGLSRWSRILSAIHPMAAMPANTAAAQAAMSELLNGKRPPGFPGADMKMPPAAATAGGGEFL